MTTTTERLQRIRAKCVELLEIAEKRTPGKWPNDGDLIDTSAGVISCDTGCSSEDNACFIVACVGPAEAGWRSTIAAIDRHARMAETVAYIANPDMAMLAIKHELHLQACDILAAWPEELL